MSASPTLGSGSAFLLGPGSEAFIHMVERWHESLLAYVYVLILSLMFLVPPSTPRMLGAMIAGPTLVVLGISLVGLIKETRQKETALDRHKLFRRRMVQIIALAMSLYGAFLLWNRVGYGVFIMITPICMILGNATGTAWDLMTQVGRLKAQDEAASH